MARAIEWSRPANPGRPINPDGSAKGATQYTLKDAREVATFCTFAAVFR